MEGLDVVRWQRHCESVRQKNAAQARKLDNRYHAQAAGFLLLLLAPLAFLVSVLGTYTAGQATSISAPAPTVRVTEDIAVTPAPAFAEVESEHPKSLKGDGASPSFERTTLSSEITIRVERGDTLWDLVGTDWPQVCELNRLADCDRIYPGQRLRVPVPRNERRSE